MIVYICGKENPNYKEEYFDADIWLAQKGYSAINPSLLFMTLPVLSNSQYQIIRYKLIEISEAVFMIHDWHQSKRACDELQYAKSLGKKIIYQDYFGRKSKQNETRNSD